MVGTDFVLAKVCIGGDTYISVSYNRTAGKPCMSCYFVSRMDKCTDDIFDKNVQLQLL